MYRFTAFERKQLEDLHHFIVSNLNRHFTLTELCHLAGMNKHKLNLGFKLMYGEKIVGYIKRTKMERADELLRTTEHTIKQIAGMTGYGHTKNFLIAYKKYFNRTAGSVRR